MDAVILSNVRLAVALVCVMQPHFLVAVPAAGFTRSACSLTRFRALPLTPVSLAADAVCGANMQSRQR